MSQLSATEKLFGTTTLDEHQAALARKTYALLGLAVAGAALGGSIGASSIGLVRFFMTLPGFFVAFLLINAVPRIALWASERSKPVALVMLAADGFLSGLVMAPLLFLAARRPAVLSAAGFVTLAVFAAVTSYIMVTRKRFVAPVGLMMGLTVGVLAAIFLNLFLNIGVFGLLISAAVAVLGVLMLVYATSDVLNNPDYDNPIQGALFLFAALFNVFVSVLRILLSLVGFDRD